MAFDPESRQIYRYYDGSVDEEGRLRIVRADPIVLYRNILEAAGGQSEFAAIWERANASEPDPNSPRDDIGMFILRRYTSEAIEERPLLAQIAQKAFHLIPLDPSGLSGLTESETIDQLYEFFLVQKKQEKSTESSPNSSGPTQASVSVSTASLTNNIGECG